jgi:hypothetical protein
MKKYSILNEKFQDSVVTSLRLAKHAAFFALKSI